MEGSREKMPWDLHLEVTEELLITFGPEEPREIDIIFVSVSPPRSL